MARFWLGAVPGRWTICLALAAMATTHVAQAGTVAAGASHTLVVKTTDSTVWAWGLNSDGQLGDNTVTQRKTPIQVTSLSGIVAVAAGAKHSLALKSDGSLWAWGDNANGQVGNGTTTDQKLPVQVLTGVSVVAAGDYHTIALKLDGTVWTWGLNGDGQLGDGGTTSRSSPAQVTGLGLVSAIAGGGNHTVVVLQAGGAMKAWGKNANGQLGDGTTTRALNPVSVSGVSNAVVAVGGGAFTMARKNDATLLAWGLNSSGQLGLGDTTQRKTATAVTALTNVATMVAGVAHGVALLGDASVRAWGRNTYGNLGDGSTTQRNSPVTVASLAGIVAVGVGQNHNVAVTSTGEVWAWGYNNQYQIGDGRNVNRLVPVKVAEAGFQWKAGTPTISPASGTFNTNQTVTMTTATSGGTIRYTTDGTDPTDSSTAYSAALSVTVSTAFITRTFKAGLAPSNPTAATYTLRALPPSFTPPGGIYTSAQTVTLATTTTGATIRYTTDGSDPTPSSAAYTGPLAVGSSATIRAAAFKAGWTTSDISSATYSYNFGTVGTPVVTPASGTYVEGVTVSVAADVGATTTYTTDGSDPNVTSTQYVGPVGLSSTGTFNARAWKPDFTPSATASASYAIKVGAPILDKPSGSYAVGDTVTVTGVSGTLRCTTNGVDPTEADLEINSGGTIPLGNFTFKVRAFRAGCTPSDITSAVYTVRAGAIGAGSAFGLALTPAGAVYAWGANASSQIGDGGTTNAALPKVVAISGVSSVSPGGSHVVAAKADGSVWTWGANESGQIGNNTTTRQATPTQVTSLSGVVRVAAGGSVSAALKGDHSLWMWGANGSGQLGLGDTTPRLTPQLVMTNVADVAVGEKHVLARKTDGSVWAWGYNQHGEVGDGTTTTRLSPVPVALTQATRIAAGGTHSMALRPDGSVWTWGDNTVGQLGDGTTTPRLAPVRVAGLLGVTDLAAGSEFSVVANSSGSVWVWGRNTSGQLGDGTTTSRYSPVRLTTLGGVVAVAAGGQHAIASTADSAVWTWGVNGSGQLGDGTTYDAGVPISLADVGYAWRAGRPVVDHYSGNYSSPFNLVLTTASAGAAIRYTLDGSTPTASSTLYAGPVSITQTTTVTAKAMLAGVPDSNTNTQSFQFMVARPALTPGGGTYTTPQLVTIASSTSGATIRYTTDGSYPSESSLQYTGAVNVGAQTVLQARAFKPGWTGSGVGIANYSFNLGTLAAPAPAPAAGTFTGSVAVTLSAASGATIRYTLDGSTPTASSPQYAGALALSETTTVKAIAVRPDWATSPVMVATYSIKCSPPTLSIPAGNYAMGTPLIVASPDVGAVQVRYTLDGTDPGTYATALAAGSTVHLMRSVTVKAVASRPNCIDSDPTTAAFTVAGPPPTATLRAGDSMSFGFLNGTLWAWGSNGWGKLGTGGGGNKVVPTPVAWSGAPALLASGTNHALAVDSGGALKAWGSNGWGQLGDGNNPTDRTQPGPAGSFAPGAVVGLAAGIMHSLAVLSDGTVYAWGAGSAGQLGDGSSTAIRNTPGLVPGLSGITRVATYNSQSFAITSAGGIMAWGTNGNGQLGNNTTSPSSVPVPVATLTAGVVSVAPGENHTLALTSAGQVYSWGNNYTGQLGDGSVNQRTAPGPVPGLTGAVAVAAADAFSAALLADGSVWVWGRGGSGQIGDGTSNSQYRPKRVAGVTKIIAIAAGRYHILALSQDGILWAWGWNTSGELGDGTTTPRQSPVAISASGGSWAVTVPTFNVTAGTYSNELDVRIDDQTAGAEIRYTLNGSDPTPGDSYLAPGGTVHIGVSAQLKARAFAGGQSSPVASATYVLAPAPPNISPGAGLISTDTNVTMAAATGTTVRYTIDGSDPSDTSSQYLVPLVASGPLVVKARAFRTGWSPSTITARTYGAKVATPILAPSDSSIANSTAVAITCATGGAEIHYAVDGSEPTLASPAVTGGQVVVDDSTTLRARAWRTGWDVSDVAGATFSLTRGQTAPPSFSPPGGAYSQAQEVTLAATAGATIRYTIDGSDPTWNSPIYRRPFAVPESQTVKAKAWVAGWADSPVASAAYTVNSGQVLMPVFSVSGGRFPTRRTVTVTCPTAGSTITFTQTGADPSSSDTSVPCGGSIAVDRSMVLKAKAWKSGATPSAARTAVFEINGMLAAGGTHYLALDWEGRVWAWGANGNGRLGDGQTTSRTTPYRLPAFGTSPVAAIAAGQSHSLALTEDGRVWAWGLNNNGQLGDNSQTQRTAPVQLAAFSAYPVVAIAAGQAHSIAVTSDGRVWVWGWGYYGQLGDGTNGQRLVPYQLPQFTASPITAVACGVGHTLALASDGGVWAWGWGQTGAIGDGSGTARNVPTPVPNLARVVRIAAGRHSLALTSDGAAWAWGQNDAGEVGDGSGANRLRPVRIRGVEGPLDLAAGYDSSMTSVVAPSGVVRLLAWGRNLKGQLGDDSIADRWRPVQVTGVDNVLAISGGEQSSLAVALDGSVRAWGFNPSGQLGVGTSTDALVPMAVTGLSLVDNTFLTGDPDGDTVPTGVELRAGTDPFVRDTNGDGLDDAAALGTGRSGTSADTDGDGLSNVAELAAGTDPLIVDTDGDGVADGADTFPLDATRSTVTPNPGDHTPPTVTLTQPANARVIP